VSQYVYIYISISGRQYKSRKAGLIDNTSATRTVYQQYQLCMRIYVSLQSTADKSYGRLSCWSLGDLRLLLLSRYAVVTRTFKEKTREKRRHRNASKTVLKFAYDSIRHSNVTRPPIVNGRHSPFAPDTLPDKRVQWKVTDTSVQNEFPSIRTVVFGNVSRVLMSDARSERVNSARA